MIRVLRADSIHDGYQLHHNSELVTKDGVDGSMTTTDARARLAEAEGNS